MSVAFPQQEVSNRVWFDPEETALIQEVMRYLISVKKLLREGRVAHLDQLDIFFED